jgi:hypothetical protein
MMRAARRITSVEMSKQRREKRQTGTEEKNEERGDE